MRLLLLFYLSLAFVQAQDVRAFLAPVRQHPGMEASRALLRAAEANLAQAYDPFSLTATAGYARFQNDPLELDPEIPQEIRDLIRDAFPTEGSASQLSLELTLRPIPFGDIADLVRQRQLDLARSRLAYLETLTTLETQALEAAYSVQLAEEGLALAQEGLSLTQEVLATTELRFARGAASQADVREAQLRVQETEGRVTGAAADLGLARFSLEQLVGRQTLPPLPELLPVRGIAPDVVRALLDVELAQVGLTRAERGLLPVAQASLNLNPSDQSAFSLSLESRTLQPRVSYSFQDPGRGFPENLNNSSFTIGVSMTISPGVFNAIEAARAQHEAASRGLQAALERSQVQNLSLNNALAAAERGVRTAQAALENAELAFAEATAREELGIATALERQAAFLNLSEARLSLASARLERLRRTLDSYRFYAMPLSENL